MSIFSLVKGGKGHEVSEMRMCGGDVLNSSNKKYYVNVFRKELFHHG